MMNILEKKNETEKIQELIIGCKNIQRSSTSTKEYYENYSKSMTDTLSTFNKKMSEILQRSIQRLDNIGFQVRECVYDIKNQEAVYLNRSTLNGDNPRNITNEMFLNNEKLNFDSVKIKGENLLEQVMRQVDAHCPPCSSFNSFNEEVPYTPSSYECRQPQIVNIDVKSENEIEEPSSSRKLKRSDSKSTSLKRRSSFQTDQGRKSKCNLKVLSIAPIVSSSMSSRKRKSINLINEENIKQEKAVLQQIKRMHKKQLAETPKFQEREVFLPEKIDSALELLREKYTSHRRRRKKKALVNKYSCEVFIPNNYKGKLNKKSSEQRIWIGPKLSTKGPVLNVSHRNILKRKSSTKENILTRKYASENFRELRTSCIRSETSYQGQAIKVTDSTQDYCVLMHTHKPERTRYELKQNSALASSSILDEVTLRDLAPLKAEYPRKDNIAIFEMPLQESLLYKLVTSDTKSLEYLVNTRKLEKVNSRPRRTSLKMLNSEINPEETNLVVEKKVVDNTQVGNCDYEKSIESEMMQLHKNEVRKELNKYMFDPTRNYSHSQTLIVMPVFVQYDKDAPEVKNIYKNAKLQETKKLRNEIFKTKTYDPIRQNVKTNQVTQPKFSMNKQNSYSLENNKPATLTTKSPVLNQKDIKKPLTGDKCRKREPSEVPNLASDFKQDVTTQQLPKNRKKVVLTDKIRYDRNNMKSVIAGMEDKFKRAIKEKHPNRTDIFNSLEREMKDILSRLPMDSNSQLALTKNKTNKSNPGVNNPRSPRTSYNHTIINKPALTRPITAIQRTKDHAIVDEKLISVETDAKVMKNPQTIISSGKTKPETELQKISSELNLLKENIGKELKEKSINFEVNSKKLWFNKDFLKDNDITVIKEVDATSSTETLVEDTIPINSTENLTTPKELNNKIPLLKLKKSPRSKTYSDLIKNLNDGDLTPKNQFKSQPSLFKSKNEKLELSCISEDEGSKSAMKKRDKTTKILEKWKTLENPVDIGEFIEDEAFYENIIKPSSDLLKIKSEDKTFELKQLEKELGNEMKKFCNEINEVMELIKPITHEEDTDDEITPRNEENCSFITLGVKKSTATINQLAVQQFLAVPTYTSNRFESLSHLNFQVEVTQKEVDGCNIQVFTEHKRGHNKAQVNEILLKKDDIKTNNNKLELKMMRNEIKENNIKNLIDESSNIQVFTEHKRGHNKAPENEILLKKDDIKANNREQEIKMIINDTKQDNIKNINVQEVKEDESNKDKIESAINETNEVLIKAQKINLNKSKQDREVIFNIILTSIYGAVFATVFLGLNLKYYCLT